MPLFNIAMGYMNINVTITENNLPTYIHYSYSVQTLKSLPHIKYNRSQYTRLQHYAIRCTYTYRHYIAHLWTGYGWMAISSST